MPTKARCQARGRVRFAGGLVAVAQGVEGGCFTVVPGVGFPIRIAQHLVRGECLLTEPDG